MPNLDCYGCLVEFKGGSLTWNGEEDFHYDVENIQYKIRGNCILLKEWTSGGYNGPSHGPTGGPFSSPASKTKASGRSIHLIMMPYDKVEQRVKKIINEFNQEEQTDLEFGIDPLNETEWFQTIRDYARKG